VTNAQNYRYWADEQLAEAYRNKDAEAMTTRKRAMKGALLDIVADQAGKLFDPGVLTIVWARRFAAYKRPDLLLYDEERFMRLLTNKDYPIQIVWAGKPYPFDEGAKQTFNKLHYRSHLHPNMAVLTGYELALSKALKDGADVWLNTPVVPREASGTSGMTAAMNAAINLSTNDGWICEFAKPGENSFIVPEADRQATSDVRDAHDRNGIFDLLEQEILPMYYERPNDWQRLVAQSMTDVLAYFGADRMAQEYYERVYV
jgi:starch phosphorylase